MKTNHHTKKSLKASGLALIVCIVMLIGTTFAWFTDSITNSGNVIQAGSLNITGTVASVDNNAAEKPFQLEGINNGQPFGFGAALDIEAKDENGDSVNKIINESLWEPGKSNAKLLTVTNGGTLAAKINLSFDVKDGGLQDALWYDFIQVKNEQITGKLTKRDMSTLKTFAENIELPLTAGSNVQFILVYGMKESADNSYQGKTFTADVTINATQLNSEEDGFGNPDYDKDANPNAVFGAANIKNAMDDPNVKEVVLGEDIDLNKEEFKEPNGNCTFVVNDGKTLNLGGNDFIRPDGGSGSGLVVKSDSTATIENGNVVAEGDMTAVDLAEGSTTTFKNVHFKGHGNELVRMRAKAGTKTTVIFKNCTFENAPVSLNGRDGATYVDVKFENCTFKGTYKMYGADGKPLADKHGHIHYTTYLISSSSYVCGEIMLKDCTMDLDAHEAEYKQKVIAGLGCSQGENLTLTLDNVTIEGKKVIPVEVDSRYKKTVKIAELGNTQYTVDGKSVTYDGTVK